ncbi:VWA domain-containing protein [Myxococcota bacterium]
MIRAKTLVRWTWFLGFAGLSCSSPNSLVDVGSIYLKTAMIRADDGGTLEVTEADHPELAGTKIIIPAGSLAEDTRITMSVGVRDLPQDGSAPAGPVIELGPTDTHLSIPAQVTIPFATLPPQLLARVYVRQADGSMDVILPDGLTMEGTMVSFELSSLADVQACMVNGQPCEGITCDGGDVCRNGGCWESCEPVDPLLHIMFVVDRSNSMQVTDPYNGRITAISDVVASFLQDPLTATLQPDVSFAIVSFWGDVAVHTQNDLGEPGFSSDGASVIAALNQLAATSSNTSYVKALMTVDEIIEASIALLTPQERERAAYQIVFLSDGLPFPDNCFDESNSLASAVRRVEILKEKAAYHDVWLTLHTTFFAHDGMFDLYLSPEEGCCMGVDKDPLNLAANCATGSDLISIGRLTRELLQQMAWAGGGLFLTFSDTNPAAFSSIEFSPAVLAPCSDGYQCEPTHGLCLPRIPPVDDACATDHDCAFSSVCVTGSCVSDEFGCGIDCAPNADDPVRILFAVDTSGSMQFTDPNGNRKAAVEEAISTVLSSYPNAQFRIVGFDHSTTSSTPSGDCHTFTQDPAALSGFLDGLVDDGMSDVQGTLNVIYQNLLTDMYDGTDAISPDACPYASPDALSRAHYHVVLITDGLPDPFCRFGMGNDFDLVNPSQPYMLCESVNFVNCLLKRDYAQPGGTECSASWYGTCSNGAAGCAYNDQAPYCCDSDHGWDGSGDRPSTKMFGGLAGFGSELRGGDAYNQPFQLDTRVRSIIALREHFPMASIRLHTVFIPNSQFILESDTVYARDMFERLAETGRGAFLEFPDAQGIDLNLGL